MFSASRYIADSFPHLLGHLRDVKQVPVKSADEIDEWHREPGIINGYRHNCSISQAVISLFNATNETVNFWTHFIPTIFFVWQMGLLSSTMPLFQDPYLFPLVCYLFASCAYPLMSCMAHAFCCVSTTASHVCFFMDYAALSIYSWGVAILYYSYAFPKSLMYTWFSSIFLPVATFNAIVATIMACSSRFLTGSPYIRKALRLSAFIIPFLWDTVPLVWYLYTCDDAKDICGESKFYHFRQFASVILASFFYGSHLPERLAPGRFDIIGNSHNLLHLFGIIATNEQLRGSLLDVSSRRVELQSLLWTTSPHWATIVTPLLIFCNFLLIVFFTHALNKKTIKIAKLKKQ
ncbi:unnamed protein product, partial [Meganyctiphanes norvegica]